MVLLLTMLCSTFAQDFIYARKLIDTLTSPAFCGRGYTNNGMQNAADFIAIEMKRLGLQPMQGKTFLQPFTFDVNTFPGKMEVAINGKNLVPGKDFIVGPQSRQFKGKGIFKRIDSSQFLNERDRVLVMLEEKLTWSVSNDEADHTLIKLKQDAVDREPATFAINIEQRLEKNFTASNVCGIVKGTTKPDSIILFSAHYDHLGAMGGDVFFPGANDNASGVAMMLSLAKYYAANPPPYSVAFIAFAAEEAGLIGSKYFVENPLSNLASIRFLINLDLLGTGEDGVTVVNATEFPAAFKLLNSINDKHKLLAKINARGKAANSDHYWFTEKGVPAFFMYTLGGITAYHDVFDVSATLPLTEYNDLFLLFKNFAGSLMCIPAEEINLR